jgi:ribonuclease P protein component
MAQKPALTRLTGPQVFSDLMRRRPLASNDWLMIYAQPCMGQDSTGLGFIIPKKSLRRAVQRNRVRRWVRAYWQRNLPTVPHHLLIRCRGKPACVSLLERRQRYLELTTLCQQVSALIGRREPCA